LASNKAKAKSTIPSYGYLKGVASEGRKCIEDMIAGANKKPKVKRR